MIVIKLTNEQKDILQGKQYAPDSFFNPIQDKNDNWVISLEEYNGCLDCEECIEEYEWIVNCEQIEYEPKEVDMTMFK
jgi:hypothetical protein